MPRSRDIRGNLILAWKALCLGAVLVPPACLVLLIWQYHVDVPFGDQWALVPLLDKFYVGTLSFQDLFAQHNEHRLLFPRVIMLILARFSGWNISHELAVSLLIVVATFAVLTYQFRVTQKHTGRSGTIWPICAISLLVFSLSQWENWLWGWQIQIFLSVFAVVAGIVVLARSELRWSNLLAALALGIVASFSFANGLLYWFIGPIILLPIIRREGKRKAIALLVWVFFGSAVVISYLHNYHSPSSHPSPMAIFERPLDLVEYSFAYLGNAISHETPLAFGLLGTVIMVISGMLLAGSRRVQLEILVPYIAMCLYAVGSAFITGIGRLGFGLWQASSPRYVTIANLFWVSNVAFMYLLIVITVTALKQPSESRGRHERMMVQRGMLILSSVVLIAVLVIATWNSLSSVHDFQARYAHLTPARAELITLEDDELLSRLYPDPDVVRKRASILQKYRLSVFRNPHPVGQMRHDTVAGPLHGSLTMGQTFRSYYPNLYRIDVLMATYARVNTHDVIFHLRESPTATVDLATIVVNAREIEDNAWHRFEFAPVSGSADRLFYFFLESPASTPDDAVTIYGRTSDCYQEGQAYLNGQPAIGDLTFLAHCQDNTGW